MAVWLLLKDNPAQERIRPAACNLGLPSTRKALTEWRESCRGQEDGWGLEHIMAKGRLRERSF